MRPAQARRPLPEMISPTFEPESTPGAGIAAYSRGVDQGQSWMERSSQMATQEQERQQRQQEIQRNTILQPVIAAKADADVATAHATLASVQRMQQLRAQAAIVSPQAEQELIDATKIPDFSQQEAALGTLQAKYSWMENVPEMKPLVDTINNARAKATTMVLANKHIESAQAIADTRAAGLVDSATTRAQASRDVADERSRSAQAVADMKTKTDLEKQQRDLEHKREVDDLTGQIAELKANTAVTVGAGHDTARTTAATTMANKKSAKDALLDRITSGGQTPAPTAASKNYKSVEEALSDNHKAGDKVIINGVSGTLK